MWHSMNNMPYELCWWGCQAMAHFITHHGNYNFLLVTLFYHQCMVFQILLKFRISNVSWFFFIYFLFFFFEKIKMITYTCLRLFPYLLDSCFDGCCNVECWWIPLVHYYYYLIHQTDVTLNSCSHWSQWYYCYCLHFHYLNGSRQIGWDWLQMVSARILRPVVPASQLSMMPSVFACPRKFCVHLIVLLVHVNVLIPSIF